MQGFMGFGEPIVMIRKGRWGQVSEPEQRIVDRGVTCLRRAVRWVQP